MRAVGVIIGVVVVGCNAVTGIDSLAVDTSATTKTPKTDTHHSGDTEGGDPDPVPHAPIEAGAPSRDAGTTSTSSVSVGCKNVTCDGPDAVCCESPASGQCSTKGKCSSTAFELQCDGNDDCGAGRVCCVDGSQGHASCESACAFDATIGKGQFCTLDADCPSGLVCDGTLFDPKNKPLSSQWFFCVTPSN